MNFLPLVALLLSLFSTTLTASLTEAHLTEARLTTLDPDCLDGNCPVPVLPLVRTLLSDQPEMPALPPLPPLLEPNNYSSSFGQYEEEYGHNEFFRALHNRVPCEVPDDVENAHLREEGDRIWRTSCDEARRARRHGTARYGGYGGGGGYGDLAKPNADVESSHWSSLVASSALQPGNSPLLPPMPAIPPAQRAQEVTVGSMSLVEAADNVTLSDGRLRAVFGKATGLLWELTVEGSATNLLVNDKQNVRSMLKRNPTTGEYYVDSPDTPLSVSERSILGIGSKNSRGYWDCNFLLPGGDLKYSPLTNVQYRLIARSDNRIEISFLQGYNPSQPLSPPFDFDIRWVMEAGGSKLYWYIAVAHKPTYPEVQLVQLRMVQRLNPLVFNYGVLSDDRQRRYPTVPDLTDARSEGVEFAEGRRLLNPENPQFAKEVDDKYHYMTTTEDDLVHGWAADGTGNFGLWSITPSKEEYLGGGPLKQELSIHTGPIMLTTLQSAHAGTPSVWVAAGENWEKTYGPGVLYVNQGASAQDIWQDAKAKAAEEQGAWPYTWPEARKFTRPEDRGSVAGRIIVDDSTEGISYEGGRIGLGFPSPVAFPLSGWQFEVKRYQYWSRLGPNGEFKISNVISGVYTIYCYIPGVLGDFQWSSTVQVRRGIDINLRDITFTTPRVGPTIWELGIPDRSAAEYLIPKLNPDNMDYPYPISSPFRYRDYGSWKSYVDTHPDDDSVFQVGGSISDWFYVQPSRKLPNGKFTSSVFKIVFDKDPGWPAGDFTLQLAVAGGNSNALLVYLNRLDSVPVLNTATLNIISGSPDNSLARPTIQGTYVIFTVSIPSSAFIDGQNTLLFQLARPSLFAYVLYDYIRLEAPK